jgi:hypothetical protein
MKTATQPIDPDQQLLQLVRETVTGIRFGSVTLVIQDGRIIQIDRNEKIRLSKQMYADGGGI